MILDNIKYLVIDVDGTMTDAGIYYDEEGNESKKFCTKDAAGFFAAYEAGIQIVVLTGRKCAATERRMKELKVPFLYQDVKDKQSFMKEFMRDKKIQRDNIGYIGDDLNDYESMKMCSFVGCPNDACIEVKERANYISSLRGGHGAVRDVIEYMLRKRGIWEQCTHKIYFQGI